MKLLLFPGMDGTGELFAPLIAALPDSIEPVVMTYPADRRLSYAELIAAARTQLPEGEPFLLLGESFGGPIALQLAAERPEGLAGLVLCCTFARNPHPRFAPFRSMTGLLPIKEIPSLVSSFVVLGADANEAQRAAFEAALRKVDSAVLRHRLREILNVDVCQLLPRIMVPTAYLRATEDRVVPESAVQPFREGIANLEIVNVPAPHFLLQTRPAEAAAEIVKLAATV